MPGSLIPPSRDGLSMRVRLSHAGHQLDLQTRSAVQRRAPAQWAADGQPLVAARQCLDTGTLYRTGELARGTHATGESTRLHYQLAEPCSPDTLRTVAVTAIHDVLGAVPLCPSQAYAIPYRYGRAGRLQTAWLAHDGEGWRLLIGRLVQTTHHTHAVLDLEIT